MRLKGLFCNEKVTREVFSLIFKNHIAVWNKKQVRVYELICDASKSDDEKVVRVEKGQTLSKIIDWVNRAVVLSGAFSSSPSNIVLFDQLLFILENGRVNVTSFQVRIFRRGSKFNGLFDRLVGNESTIFNLCSKRRRRERDQFEWIVPSHRFDKRSRESLRYLSTVRIDRSTFIYGTCSIRRESRQVGKTLNINAHTPSVDSIREMSVNCNGTKVIVLTSQVTIVLVKSSSSNRCVVGFRQIWVRAVECICGMWKRIPWPRSTLHRKIYRERNMVCCGDAILSTKMHRSTVVIRAMPTGIRKILVWWRWKFICTNKNWIWPRRCISTINHTIYSWPVEARAMTNPLSPERSQHGSRQLSIKKIWWVNTREKQHYWDFRCLLAMMMIRRWMPLGEYWPNLSDTGQSILDQVDISDIVLSLESKSISKSFRARKDPGSVDLVGVFDSSPLIFNRSARSSSLGHNLFSMGLIHL